MHSYTSPFNRVLIVAWNFEIRKKFQKFLQNLKIEIFCNFLQKLQTILSLELNSY